MVDKLGPQVTGIVFAVISRTADILADHHRWISPHSVHRGVFVFCFEPAMVMKASSHHLERMFGNRELGSEGCTSNVKSLHSVHATPKSTTS